MSNIVDLVKVLRLSPSELISWQLRVTYFSCPSTDKGRRIFFHKRNLIPSTVHSNHANRISLVLVHFSRLSSKLPPVFYLHSNTWLCITNGYITSRTCPPANWPCKWPLTQPTHEVVQPFCIIITIIIVIIIIIMLTAQILFDSLTIYSY